MGDNKKFKKKAPEVRQTLTSLYRRAKQDPTLITEKNTLKISDKKHVHLKLPPAVTRRLPASSSEKVFDLGLDHLQFGKASLPVLRQRIPKNAPNTLPVEQFKVPRNVPNKPRNILEKQGKQEKKIAPKNNSGIIKHKISKINTTKKSNKHQIRTRRSLSAQHFESKKHMAKLESEKVIEKRNITQSMEDISDLPCTPRFTGQYVQRLPHTPMSGVKVLKRTPQPTMMDLEIRLNNWLKKRGKPLTSFKNLKYFGGQKTNKENEEPNIVRSDSYEALNIPENNFRPPTQDIIKNALDDLYKLVVQGYSLSQCEQWLANIREKYKRIEDEPSYWECRAAIEQNRGNLSSAVECYRTAIIQGAKEKEIEKLLDDLLEKFNLLSIDSNNKNTKHISEVRDVFKSSIIQFAVKERDLMKKNKDERELIITPVRRSTRKSRSMYKVSDKKIYSTLQEISPDSTIMFKNNGYLL